MSGSAALRLSMLGLVLVNMLFVQLTEAAGPQWLVPLFLLAVLSPVLSRFREKKLYQTVWNVAVLGIFALLARHAIGNDLQYVLEDGLVLSVFCQVHLLNNMRADQRPDLLFLNSFLIAIVTAYLSQDLAYSGAFLVYVPLFVVGLQLHCITGKGEVEGIELRHIVWDGLRRTGILLTGTLLVFFFWPRDFHRKSLLPVNFDFASGDVALEIGFNEELRLGRKGTAGSSDVVVMRAQMLRGSRSEMPSLWRGGTLGWSNGEAWRPLRESDAANSKSDDPWVFQDRRYVRADKESGPLLSVEIVEHDAKRLFTPLSATEVAVDPEFADVPVHPRADGTLRYGPVDSELESLRFELALAELSLELRGAIPKRTPRSFAPYVELPTSRSVSAATNLAQKLAERRPEIEVQHELVELFRQYLEQSFEYLHPGSPGGASNLQEFLAGRAGGHCELFASALTTMLRSRGVPSRIVTGYRATEWDEAGRLVIRERDAHAWVEVYDPEGGWYTVDPNPRASAVVKQDLWKRLHAAVGQTWAKLAGFDSKRRGELVVWARGLPATIWRFVKADPVSTSLVLLATLLLVTFFRVHRRTKLPPGVDNYQRMLRRSGLLLVPGETPRELLVRADDVGVAPERFEALRKATREHEAKRYAA